MKAVAAIVESVFDYAIREINALEQRGVKAEDDADETWWEQAGVVVEQLAAGLSRRKLAAQWINTRTGNPYDERHVRFVEKVWHKGAEYTPQSRPRYRDLYNAISNNPKNRFVHNSGDFEWYTPADYIEAARSVLGAIDLDPASTPTANAVVQARRFYTLEDDGLAHDWVGTVWMNPPYANALVSRFAQKLVESVQSGTVPAAVAIVNNCTETRWFDELFTLADALCFPRGRVPFWKPEQSSDSPLQGQTVFYFGPNSDAFYERFAAFGNVVRPWR